MSLRQEPFELAVSNAQALLNQALAEQQLLVTQLAEAQADIDSSQAQNAFALAEFERYQALIDKRLVAQSELDKKREGYDIAKSDLLKATKAYQDLVQQKAVRQAQVEYRQSALGQAQYDLQVSQIYAPSDGYINHLRVYAGDYASEGETLFGFVVTGSEIIIANIKCELRAKLYCSFVARRSRV